MGSLGPRGDRDEASEQGACVLFSGADKGREVKGQAQLAIPKSGVAGGSQPAGLTAVHSELQEPGFKFPSLRSPLVM